jgi:hypothetical protein
VADRLDLQIEACPECGTPGVEVTYMEQLGGEGQVVFRAVHGVGCPKKGCVWYHPAAAPEDANQAAARTLREATDGK